MKWSNIMGLPNHLVAVLHNMGRLFHPQVAQRQIEVGFQQEVLDPLLLFWLGTTLHFQPGNDALVLDNCLEVPSHLREEDTTVYSSC